MSEDNPNKDICDMLIKLGEHERDVNGIIYKYHAYRKASKALEQYGKRVQSGSEAQKLSGIGPKIAAKIEEFLQNGGSVDDNNNDDKKSADSSKAKEKPPKKKSKKTDDQDQGVNSQDGVQDEYLKDDFMENYHLFHQMSLIDAMNLRIVDRIDTIGDLKSNKNSCQSKLSKNQLICLEYYHDLRRKLSRKEQKKYFIETFEQILRKLIDKQLIYVEYCGEYRRQQPKVANQLTVLVIDLQTKSNDPDCGQKLSKLMQKINEILTQKNFVETNLSYNTKDDYSFTSIIKASINDSEDSKKLVTLRSILHVFLVPKDQYICRLFHLTGSERFWNEIRLKLLERHLILTEKSLKSINIDTMALGQPIKLKSEEELFEKYLKQDYIEPKQRN